MPTVAFQLRELSTSKQAVQVLKHKQTSTCRSDLLLHFSPACAHIATRHDSMRNSNRLVYTSTYKAVPIHADLQLARKPRVAAHTAPPKPKTSGPTTCIKAACGCPHAPMKPVHADLQLARPADTGHSDHQLARHANTRHSDQQLANKPRLAAHTPAGVEVHDWGLRQPAYLHRDFIANIHSVQAWQPQGTSGFSHWVIQLQASI